MARTRAVIRTPYPSADSVAKALGIPRRRAQQIALMVDHLRATNGKTDEAIYRAFRAGRLTKLKRPPKRRSKT